MIPTESGYYWCSDGEDRIVVYVKVPLDRVFVPGDDDNYSIADFTDYQGPLKPPEKEKT